MKGWLKRLEIDTEEIILLIIIILNIIDAVEVIGSDLDFIKKIISWAALGLLIYRVKLSKLFVGTDNKNLDLALLAGYFLLTIKNLISYAFVEVGESSIFLKDFFTILVQQAINIETWGIYLGLIILIFVSIRLSFKKIKNPSIMHVIHATESKPLSLGEFFLRFITIFGVVIGFFIVFFNLIMEWLAIAIDAPLLMIGLAIYLFFVIKHKEKFSQTSFLKKFGDYGSKLYEDVLEDIKYRKTIFRTISAMIILHVVTDTYTFVWPYLMGIGDRLYLGLLSNAHYSVFHLLSTQLSNLSIMESTSLIIIYLGNVIALLFFLLFPVYTWFVFYKNKIIKPKKIQLSIIVSSLVMFFLSPTFKIKSLFGEKIFGVDIIGQQSISVVGFTWVVIAALAAGIFVELYSATINHEKWVVISLIFLSQAFLAIYMFLYLYSISTYYIFTISQLYINSLYTLLLFFCILFIGTLGFYFFGVGHFIKDTFKHIMEHVKLERKRF